MPSAMIFAARAPSNYASRAAAKAALPSLILGSRPARPQLGLRVCPSPIARSSGFHSSAASSSSAFSSASSAASASTTWSDSILSTFDPLIPYVHSLPEYLHLSGSPHGYALSIVVLTFFLRSTITLPFQLWARKRQARLQDEVMPRWNVLKGKDGLPLVKMKEARRQGKPFEVYKKELEEEVGPRRYTQKAGRLADRHAPPLTATIQTTVLDQGVRLAAICAHPCLATDTPSLSHPPDIAPNNGKRS